MRKTKLRKTAILFVSLLMVIVMIPLSSSASPMTPTSLLVLGDSIAAGYGLEDQADRFGDILSENFRFDESQYVNMAANGLTSSQMADSMSNTLDEIKSSELIVISIGGNDIIDVIVSLARTQAAVVDQAHMITDTLSAVNFLLSMNAADLQALFTAPETEALVSEALVKYTNNMTNILPLIKTNNATARVILFNQYNPLDGYAPATALNTYLDGMIGEFNKVTLEIAKEAYYEVADAYSAFRGMALTYINLLANDIHPTVAGQAKLAEIILEMLDEYSVYVPVKANYHSGGDGSVVYSVEIVWGSLSFNYYEASEGTWDPATHSYVGVTDAGWGWEDDANKVTVSNHSNAPVDVSCSYLNLIGNDFDVVFDKTSFRLDAPEISNELGNPTPAPTDTFTIVSISGELAKSAKDRYLGLLTVIVSAVAND